MLRTIKNALGLLIVFTVLTGFIYPFAVTWIARVVFPVQAGGSLIIKNGIPVGSALIGQPFSDTKYFWGRPSATQPFPYNAASSAGSNEGQSNPDLLKSVQESIAALKAADSENTNPVPVDLVTASGSGLDPHISPAAAEYQVHRVAKERGMDEAEVRALVKGYTEGRQFGILGEPAVNVLKLNLALDENAQ